MTEMTDISISIIRNIIHRKNLHLLENTKQLEIPEIPEIQLIGKYLNEYTTQIDRKNKLNLPIMNIDYRINKYSNMMTEYKYKLKQYLHENKCIHNRLKQNKGTCWLNAIINNFMFNSYLKHRIKILIDYYINNKIIDINIENIIEPLFEEDDNRNTDEKDDKDESELETKIVKKLIHIFYQIIYKDGIRDCIRDGIRDGIKDGIRDSKYNVNLCISNLAILIKYYTDFDENNLERNSSSSSYGSISNISYCILLSLLNNKIIYTIPNIEETFITRDDNNIYSINFNNDTINNISLNIDTTGSTKVYIHNISTLSPIDDEHKYINITKLDIKFGDGFVLDEIDITDERYDERGIYTISSQGIRNLDFLTVYVNDGNSIPKHIHIDNIKFELSSAVLCVKWDKTKFIKTQLGIGHAITGFKFGNEYYIYDSMDRFFKADITNLSEINIPHIYNFYKLFMMNLQDDDKLVYDLEIHYSYAIYHNTMKY
jgi:hypothetical protein